MQKALYSGESHQSPAARDGSQGAVCCGWGSASAPRWYASAGGMSLAAWGLSRKSLGGLLAAVGGTCLAYYGSTGRWPFAEQLNGILSEQLQLQKARSRSQATAAAGSPGPQTGTSPEVRQWYPPSNADAVDEASMDSFPASDPPSYMG